MDQQPKRGMDGMGPRPGMDGMMRRPASPQPPAAPAPVPVKPKRSFGRSAVKPPQPQVVPAPVPAPAPAPRPAVKPVVAPKVAVPPVAPAKTPAKSAVPQAPAADKPQSRRWLRTLLQGIAWVAIILGVAAALVELYVRYYQ
jgi:hypothetical protein